MTKRISVSSLESFAPFAHLRRKISLSSRLLARSCSLYIRLTLFILCAFSSSMIFGSNIHYRKRSHPLFPRFANYEARRGGHPILAKDELGRTQWTSTEIIIKCSRIVDLCSPMYKIYTIYKNRRFLVRKPISSFNISSLVFRCDVLLTPPAWQIFKYTRIFK